MPISVRRYPPVEGGFGQLGNCLFECMLPVPANRMGFLSGQFSAAQLKITQEAVTLLVFALFSVFHVKEKWTRNYLAAFVCILLAVYFVFIGR